MTQHAVLPILTLTIGIVGQWVVIMRSALSDTLREDFVTTSRAVGLPGHRVLHHATRNAILPVVALTAINLGFIVSGATVVETLFSWPGMGLLTYNAILNKDYPLLQGVFLVASAGRDPREPGRRPRLHLPRPAGASLAMAATRPSRPRSHSPRRRAHSAGCGRARRARWRCSAPPAAAWSG